MANTVRRQSNLVVLRDFHHLSGGYCRRVHKELDRKGETSYTDPKVLHRLIVPIYIGDRRIFAIQRSARNPVNNCAAFYDGFVDYVPKIH